MMKDSIEGIQTVIVRRFTWHKSFKVNKIKVVMQKNWNEDF